MKTAGTPPDRIAMLKGNYEELLNRALEEDKQRASMYIRPHINTV